MGHGVRRWMNLLDIGGQVITSISVIFFLEISLALSLGLVLVIRRFKRTEQIK